MILNKFTYFSSQCKKRNITRTLKYFIDYFNIRLKYGIGIDDYFVNDLFDKNINHDDYFHKLHRYIHSWPVVVKNFANDFSNSRLAKCRADYLFSKIICPGLDPMDYFSYKFYDKTLKQKLSFVTEKTVLKIDRHFNPVTKDTIPFIKMLENKGEFNKFFPEMINRKWILSMNLTLSELSSFVSDLNCVIAKPLCGGAGNGIFLQKISSSDDIVNLFNIVSKHPYIIEEVIKQNKSINDINPSSINTIRVCSIMHKNEPIVMCATFRIGAGDKPTDNYSSGGMAANIDVQTGVVYTHAVNQYGKEYDIHPISGKPIKGFQIPSWDLVIQAVKDSHAKIPCLGYIGWDVTILENGNPAFIEANTCAGFELQQRPCGEGKKYLYKKYW